MMRVVASGGGGGGGGEPVRVVCEGGRLGRGRVGR